MLIYFDESYDGKHDYLVLGALFNPHSAFLHRELSEIKTKAQWVTLGGDLKEIKYSSCSRRADFEVCQQAIDSFIKSTSWYRCVVIDQRESHFDLSYFGRRDESIAIKKARAYKKFAELLIAHNTTNVSNGVLLTDRLTRCSGDEFREVMKREFSTPGSGYSAGKSVPILRAIEEVDTALEQYQVGQVCDLLSGCVLNNLCPTSNKYKNMIREYLSEQLGVPSLLKAYWGQYGKLDVERYHPKFNIWYWESKKETGHSNHPTGSLDL